MMAVGEGVNIQQRRQAKDAVNEMAAQSSHDTDCMCCEMASATEERPPQRSYIGMAQKKA